jgi:hypothetical protein
MEDTKNKKLAAYHEVGHAIAGSVLENHDEVENNYNSRGGIKVHGSLKKIKCYFLVLRY